jgi:hypothetical protein
MKVHQKRRDVNLKVWEKKAIENVAEKRIRQHGRQDVAIQIWQ